MDPARQVVAELAANAATHSRVPGRDFKLTLYVVGDTLRIEVTDTCGDRPPCLQDPTPDAESGRASSSSRHSPTAGAYPWDHALARRSGRN